MGFHFCEVPAGVKLTETERRTVAVVVWGRGTGSYLMGQSFSWKSFGDGWWCWVHKVNVLNATKLYDQKWLKW